MLNIEILCKKFIERGFHEKEIKNTVKQVAKMDRNELLQDRIRENKDPQTILVSTWHSKLSFSAFFPRKVWLLILSQN